MAAIRQSWYLVQRPKSEKLEAGKHFEWREEPLPETLDAGSFLVRHIYLSLDPTNRIWASDVPQYMPPSPLNEVMRGLTIGVVEKSENSDYPVGTYVSYLGGFTTHNVVTKEAVAAFPPGKLDWAPGKNVPLTAYLALINLVSGFTAYVGLLETGAMKEGDVVLVSGAAGAVGSMVVQMARLKGAKRVVGIAGGATKKAYLLEELGCDAAIDYKATDNMDAAIKEACPDGVDVFFDNVGGVTLDAAFLNMKLNGRISICGAINMYNEIEGGVSGPKNFGMTLMQRLTVKGFICTDHLATLWAPFEKDCKDWVASNAIKYSVFKTEGLDKAIESLDRLFTGDKPAGAKLVCQISAEPDHIPLP
uniref:Enoyl reductase (ER) domain-containing protein n=1 Tax=Paramoeba aestuarina TaxID=180227 RepID=A0A6U2Y499_9EUKA|eukprot:CAMPEP_0201522634 /NCGR_PEP_ID=MMETSP0161_2-20130828/18452_1 /ASSEMBLY_ACC=CAM_ASM_000251 /TAXON_ID=180227 /ORGANISM="Neoparamoeba aestuarina, Strain SoJaBio B1-5/56/2" /LENGTH=361 /DNA_ID=CAMNT_0047921543 /DNA_START=54 /DNA_END=1139 /DNA_ORIENTATION=+